MQRLRAGATQIAFCARPVVPTRAEREPCWGPLTRPLTRPWPRRARPLPGRAVSAGKSIATRVPGLVCSRQAQAGASTICAIGNACVGGMVRLSRLKTSWAVGLAAACLLFPVSGAAQSAGSLRRKIARRRSDIAALQQQIAALKSNISSLQGQQVQLQRRLHSLRQQRQWLREKNRLLQTTIWNLNGSAAAAEPGAMKRLGLRSLVPGGAAAGKRKAGRAGAPAAPARRHAARKKRKRTRHARHPAASRRSAPAVSRGSAPAVSDKSAPAVADGSASAASRRSVTAVSNGSARTEAGA